MKPLSSVLIVEPSDIICEGLRLILDETGGFNVLSPLHDSVLLLERLPIVSPDILIVNPTLFSSDARHLLLSIAQLRPAMPIIALVYQYVEPQLMENFQHCIDIRSSRSGISNLLRSLVAANNTMSVSTEGTENYELSERETDVLVLVAKGLSSKEIASKLHISIHTVNSHRKNITHKTGIRSVAGLAVYAMIHNLM